MFEDSGSDHIMSEEQRNNKGIKKKNNGFDKTGPWIPSSGFAGYGTVNRTPVLHGVK